MLSPSEDEIQRLCDDFRLDWTSEFRPLIEDYLNGNPEVDRSKLARALLLVEIQERQSRGERVRASDYAPLGKEAVAYVVDILDESILSESPNQLDVTREVFASDDANSDEASDESSEELLLEIGDVPTNQTPGSPPFVASRHGYQPKQIGRYRLLQEIGHGGMGSVWKAEQREPVRRFVALKVVRADITSRDAVARFEAERQAIALMDHQNIAKILDAGETDDGDPFFVMELVNGVPLNKYCDNNKLTVRQRLELMLPVCRAVQHAHQKGIIHRDLKHSNVLVTEYDGQPVPKVIDFGLAKALGHQTILTDSTMFTEAGKVVGTIQYMSPEQASSKTGADIDTRSDVYSLGVILYKLLTGGTPLENATIVNLSFYDALKLIREKGPSRPSVRLPKDENQLADIAERRQIPPARLKKQIEGDLDWIVLKALENDRRERYQTANGMALDIERYLNSEPILAGPGTRIDAIRKFVRRNQGLVAALAGVTLLLLTGIIATTSSTFWALTEKNRANQQALIAKRETKNVEELRRKAEISLQALQMKSAWSNWQLGDIESAFGMLKQIDDSKAGWEKDFLTSEFNSTQAILYGHGRSVNSVDVSPDGKFIVSASDDHTVKLWSARTLKVVSTRYMKDHVRSVCFASDSKRFACAGCENSITIWHVDTEEPVAELGPMDSDINCVAFVPETDLILAGLSTKDSAPAGYLREEVANGLAPTIQVWSVSDKKLKQTLEGHDADVSSMACSPDGKMLVSGSLDSSVRIWKRAENEFSHFETIEKHTQPVMGVAFSPNGDEFSSCGEDGAIQRWKVDGTLISTISGHFDYVNSVSYSPDGQRILSTAADRKAAVWSLNGELQLVCQGHYESVVDAVFVNSGEHLVTASNDKTMRFWNSSSRQNTSQLKASKETIWMGDFSPDGKTIAVASEDGRVSLIDVESGKLKEPKLENEVSLLSLSYSPDGKLLAVGGVPSENGQDSNEENSSKVFIWDPAEGKLVHSFDAHGEAIWGVSFSPDGRFLATASSDKTVRIWNVGDWSLHATLEGHTSEVASVKFSRDGKWLVSASDDTTLRLWDVGADYQLKHVFGGEGGDGHSHSVWRAEFSPTDNDLIASSSYDGDIILWSIESGKMLRKIAAHSTQIAGLAFSPNGKRLVSASDDRTLKIWDLSLGVEFLVLRDEGDSEIVHVSFSPDGERLLSTNADGWVTIRSAEAPSNESDMILPSEAAELTVKGLVYLYQADLGVEQLEAEVARAKRCCDSFHGFESYINLGIGQYRLGNYRLAIEALEEARRLEPIQYGDIDVRPDTECFLSLAYLKNGQPNRAEEVRKVFESKSNRPLWDRDNRVVEMIQMVRDEFEDAKIRNAPR